MKVKDLIEALQLHGNPESEVMTPDFGYGDLYSAKVTFECGAGNLVIIESGRDNPPEIELVAQYQS